jgi:hypothetical protein
VRTIASGSQHRTISANKPADRPLAVRVGVHEVGRVANWCSEAAAEFQVPATAANVDR